MSPPSGGGPGFGPSGVNLEQWILVNFRGIPLEKSMHNENETFLYCLAAPSFSLLKLFFKNLYNSHVGLILQGKKIAN